MWLWLMVLNGFMLMDNGLIGLMLGNQFCFEAFYKSYVGFCNTVAGSGFICSRLYGL